MARKLTYVEYFVSILNEADRPLTQREITDKLFDLRRGIKLGSIRASLCIANNRGIVKMVRRKGFYAVYANPKWVGEDGELLPEYQEKVDIWNKTYNHNDN
jgi:hypothetical protein